MNEWKEEGGSNDCYSSGSNDCYVRVKEERQNMYGLLRMKKGKLSNGKEGRWWGRERQKGFCE